MEKCRNDESPPIMVSLELHIGIHAQHDHVYIDWQCHFSTLSHFSLFVNIFQQF